MRQVLFYLTVGAAFLQMGCPCPCRPPPRTASSPPLNRGPITNPLEGLEGFVDLHVHPMASLGFAGKLIHGGNDEGSILPADSQCQFNVRAESMEQALGPDTPTHGGLSRDNPCGDPLRKIFIEDLEKALGGRSTPEAARGFSKNYCEPEKDGNDFAHWPTWDDVTHQKMWVDSLKRAADGGLRVMVALAVNNATIAQAVKGPLDTLPDDDWKLAKLQLEEMRAFVDRHDFMEIAYSPEDLERIVRASKLAIVLGIEVDNLGNMHDLSIPNESHIKGIIQEAHALGARYIFPIHVIDNPLGGASVYQEWFNISNYYETGSYWAMTCSQPGRQVAFRYHTELPFLDQLKIAVFERLKLGAIPPTPMTPNPCGEGMGHVNSQGLSPLGEVALKEMMRLGMLIDIDHMSDSAAEKAIELAMSIDESPATGKFDGYPLFSGHNSVRTGDKATGQISEYARTVSQYQRIAEMHGMAGVGTTGLTADLFIRDYKGVLAASGDVVAGFGTDTNGLVPGMPPRNDSKVVYDADFQKSRLGTHQWDYNRDGVAHYGMVVDYMKDMQTLQGGQEVIDNLMKGAEWFLESWRHAEKQKTKVEL